MINRAADNVRPLLTIAEVAGGDWPELAREAVSTVIAGAGDEAESIGVQLLTDIRSIFTEEKLPTKLLLDRLHGLDGRPWPEYGRKQQPISASQLARHLRKYGIVSGSIRWREETPKGYQLSAFFDVFARYLPNQAATTPQTIVTKALSDIPSRHNIQSVAVGKPPKPTPTNGCGVVAAGIPPTPGNTEISDLERPLEDDVDERAALQDDGMDLPDFLRR